MPGFDFTLMAALKLLLVGDERKNRRMSAWGFGADGYQVRRLSSRVSVEAIIAADPFHVACVDLKMREDDGPAIVGLLHHKLPQLPIVALVGEMDRDTRGALTAQGVSAFLTSPFPIEELHALVRAHALREPVMVVTASKAQPVLPGVAGGPMVRKMMSDEIARRTLELAHRAARSNAAILLQGETGTGKSLLAVEIHQNSAIRRAPFVTVNCPCLNHELLESELFGHVRGAFTGAVQDTMGKVAAADGGTLLLDEIGDLPLVLQPKLLRLLQEKQYERVGEATSRRADVRIIAATNRDLKTEVLAGRFREDLYYRVNVVAIEVPALRGRPAQIMGAAGSFLETVSAQIGKPVGHFSPEAQRLLESYSWPGNFRELRNVVERAAILSSGPILDIEDFPALLAPARRTAYQVGGAVSLRALENAHIQMVVANSASLEEAARILEIDKSTLYRKRKQIESRLTPFAAAVENGAIAAATGS